MCNCSEHKHRPVWITLRDFIYNLAYFTYFVLFCYIMYEIIWKTKTFFSSSTSATRLILLGIFVLLLLNSFLRKSIIKIKKTSSYFFLNFEIVLIACLMWVPTDINGLIHAKNFASLIVMVINYLVSFSIIKGLLSYLYDVVRERIYLAKMDSFTYLNRLKKVRAPLT
ncbi:membrane hypothetical protein [Oenococcus oeni]|nr:membrane hypothetical protein [Oenococcus oeni]